MPGQEREARLRAGRPGHPRIWHGRSKTWMAGTSPAMTRGRQSPSLPNSQASR